MAHKYYTFNTLDGVYVNNGDAPIYLISENYVYNVRGINLMQDDGVIIGKVTRNNIVLNKRNPSALRILTSCGYTVSYNK